MPGGPFVFSTEHPMYTSPKNLSWNADLDAPPNDDYSHEGPGVINVTRLLLPSNSRPPMLYISFLFGEVLMGCFG